MWEYCGKMALRAWGQSRFSRRAAMVFLAGFLAGLSLVFIGQEGLVQNTAFLNHDSLEGIGALEINRQRLMLYSLRQRLLPAGTSCACLSGGSGRHRGMSFPSLERLLRGDAAFCAFTQIWNPGGGAVRGGNPSSGLSSCPCLLAVVWLVHFLWIEKRRKDRPVFCRWRNAFFDSLCSSWRVCSGGICESFGFGSNVSAFSDLSIILQKKY